MSTKNDLEAIIRNLEADLRKCRCNGIMLSEAYIAARDRADHAEAKLRERVDGFYYAKKQASKHEAPWEEFANEFKARAERAEAKLRELAESALWWDECLAAAPWFELPAVSTFTDQRDEADAEFAATKNKAKADYRAALEAIIEEFAPAKEVRK